MKQTSQKINEIIEDNRITPNQKETLKAILNHVKSFQKEETITSLLYTLREYGIFIKKDYEKATINDLKGYLETKKEAQNSITNNRILSISKATVSVYKYRINFLYRWLIKNTNAPIDNELAYSKPQIVLKEEKTTNIKCKQRTEALLKNIMLPNYSDREDKKLTFEQLQLKYMNKILDPENLQTLKDFTEYKFSSTIVTSHTGFIGKLCFLKRLGLFLKNRSKTYKQATRLDIQQFISQVQEAVSNKKHHKHETINPTYKACLLDFYRYVYGMFENEQPRKYPEVVSWLYVKRKKIHDKIPKEILSDKELKQLIDFCQDPRTKCIMSLLADCSARVSELVGVNIEDLKINEIRPDNTKYTHSIATIKLKGKTGERTNQLFFSVPYLRVWLLNHPFKDNPKAPLFIAIKENRYGQRLTPSGINKLLQKTGHRAGIKKHLHAHLFRHTNLTKMAKILSESELKIHAGWGSNSNMAEVYVHLTSDDVSKKILQAQGIISKEESEVSILQKQFCPNTICGFENVPEARFCLKCGYPLTLKTALSLNTLKQQESELQTNLLNKSLSGVKLSEVTDMREAMYQILKSDPALISKLKDIVLMAQNLENSQNNN